MESTLAALRAMAEPTRLRLLALCAQGELTVSEMVGIVGQSQPRVSRHLKLLCDGGLLERFPEGAWVFYRVAERGPAAALLKPVLAALEGEADAAMAGDARRLATIKQARAEAAAAYFSENAGRWAELRSLHVDEAEVETALRRALGHTPIGDLLDVGTGTGRILEVLGPEAERAWGIDQSRAMLALARARVEAAGLHHCSVRQADMYALPYPDSSFDTVIIHQVLHFADHPAGVVAEAARVLKARGRLAIVDFAPHRMEVLRTEHKHRRLGFADSEVADWCAAAGLDFAPAQLLPGLPLTVAIWLAGRPPLASSSFLGGLTATVGE